MSKDVHPINNRSFHVPACGSRTCRLFPAVLACLAIAGLAAVAWPEEGNRARISVLIATGMPGGTYHQVGLGMASLWTTRLRRMGIRVSAAISEGSMENIEAIRIADADMILAEDLFCSTAYKGTGIYKGRPLRELRSITTLWPDVVHLLIRADKIDTGTLEDLNGLTIATGLPDSGHSFTTELLLKALPFGSANTRLRPMSNMAAAEALRKGQVDGADLTDGMPVPLVTSLFSEGKTPFVLLNITDSQMQSVRKEGWRHVFRQTIPADTYPGQDEPVYSVGQMNILAVTASLNAQVVYALTKTLYENLDYLVKVHPACRNIVLERALDGLNVPLHPGAIRYFKERKIKIPERLIP